MNIRPLDDEAIFQFAKDLSDSTKRGVYLDQVCRSDQELRTRIEALLDSHESDTNFLKSNDGLSQTADHTPIRETEGQQIGRYKLLQRIGEGGFGVVFMAEQQRPVRRKVALKIIKPGMDTREVIARFEAERQALAMMDHTNIARVLDGGATDSGRPFFVMELVKGVPITEYCDKNQLSTEERLTLFATVCQAVQHAHQKGIIHRDIKPSNVLVTLADGQPVVKVIDFGVAKATNQQLTEKTLFTAFGQMVGTPQYMSPEQAEMSCLDVDTRSDVYSLGVLLYELLTGTTPLEAKRLRTAGYAEMQRMIREEEPPKPSTRLSTSGDQLTVLAQHRSIAPEKLKREVRGDLDWIVMKSLEKDRNRRFESPNEFSQDVARYLRDEPVESRPPTVRYRAAKYLRRNRAALTVVSLVFFLLFAGFAGTVSQWLSAREALREWGYELVDRGLEAAFRGDTRAVGEIVEKGRQNEVVPEEWCLLLEGLVHNFGESSADAGITLKEAYDIQPGNLAIMASYSHAFSRHRNQTEWEDLAARLFEAEASGDFLEFKTLLLGWANIYIDSERSMGLIQSVVADRPNWPIANVILAAAEAHVALEKDDFELALQAVTRIRDADSDLKKNQFSKSIKAWALLVALKLAAVHEPDRVNAFQVECERTVQQFGMDVFAAPTVRGMFLEVTEQGSLEDKAFHEEDGDWWRACSLAYFYRHGRPELAFESGVNVDQKKMPLAAITKFSLLAVKGEIEEAMNGYDRIMSEHDGAFVRAHAMYIPVLAGHPEIAKQDAQRILREEARNLRDLPWHRSRTRLNFLAGEYSPDKFLEEVGGSGLGECYANYSLAVSHLHQQPEKARHYLLECIATNQIFAIEYYMAKALIEQHPKLRATTKENQSSE